MADKPLTLTPEVPYQNHGNTVASWALVIITVIGAIVAAVGFDTFHWPIVIAGLVIMVVGIIAGIALRAAGYGQGGAKTKYKHH